MDDHHHDEYDTTPRPSIAMTLVEEAVHEKHSSHGTSTHSLPTICPTTEPEITWEPENKNRHDSVQTLEASETTCPAVVVVPRPERRGLFARFAIVAEVTEPTHYENKTKWLITFTVAVAAAAAPVGSAIIFPVLDDVSRNLGASVTVTNLSVALYMLSMAIFPLWWSAFSEASGRRTIYLISFAMFIVFGTLCAVSQTIGMLIVMRMLNGGAAASVQAVGAGTIADIWEPGQRGHAMSVFYLGPLCGPLFAPVIGGVVGEHWGWRATQWVLVIYGILAWLLLFTLLPETLKSKKPIETIAQADVQGSRQTPVRPPLNRIPTTEAVKKESKKYAKMARMLFIDPLKIIAYLRFPPVLLIVYYASVTFGSLYILNVSIQYTFERPPYQFSTIIIGLLYLPNSLGYVLASLFGGKWMDKIMKREAIKAGRYLPNGKLHYLPEDRMRENAWLGAILYPSALLWYGWTANHGVFWLVPMIANFFYGVGSMLIFAMATTMLTEFMPKKSSAGIAINNLMRNIFSCVGGIVGAPLIASIGNGWLFTILGLWTFSSAMVIWAMKRYGPKWRERIDRELN